MVNEQVSGREKAWLVMLTLAACLLRWLHLDQASLSHFDEGVYVLWGVTGGYPSREFFAPPLFPWMIQVISAVAGPSDLGPRMLSGLFGGATVPLVWWISRRRFGSTAAIASASVAAFSGFHIAFSRLALTDATFTFWFVLALLLISELLGVDQRNETLGDGRVDLQSQHSQESTTRTELRPLNMRTWLITLAAGVSAGAAINTKYNGFLVLAIPAVSLVIYYVIGVLPKKIVGRFSEFVSNGGNPSPLWRLIIVACIAGLLYLPWYWHVQSTYGYGALLAHHRGYSSGMRQWLENLQTMFACQHFLDHFTGFVGPVVGLIATLAWTGSAVSVRNLSMLGLFGLVGLALGDALGWTAGLLWLLIASRGKTPSSWVPVVWILTFLVLTPLYQPYARLMLPLIAGGWVAYGSLLSRVISPATQGTGRIRFGWPAAWLACVAGALVSYVAHVQPAAAATGSVGNLRTACERLVQSIAPGDRAVNYVRPPALYYLYQFAGSRVGPPGDPSDRDMFRRWLTDRSAPGLVVIDLALLHDNPSLREELDAARGELREVARFPYRPARAVLLDDFGRRCLAPNFEAVVEQTYQLIVYRRQTD